MDKHEENIFFRGDKWFNERLIPKKILEKYEKRGVPLDLLLSYTKEISPYIQLGKNGITSANPRLRINEKNLTLKELSVISGVNYVTLLKRFRKGITPEDLVNTEYLFQKIKIENEEKTIGEWAEKSGISPNVIYRRLQNGWKEEQLLAPYGTKKQELYKFEKLTIDGETKTIEEWAKEKGLKPQKIYQRLKNNWKLDELFFPSYVTNKSKFIYLKEQEYKDKPLTINGETKTFGEWANELNIPIFTLVERSKKGYKDDKLIKGRKEERIYVELDGKKKTITELSKMFGLPKKLIYGRIKHEKKGWEIVLPKDPAYISVKMETYLLKDWMKILGITPKDAFFLYKKYQDKKLEQETIDWMLEKLKDYKANNKR